MFRTSRGAWFLTVLVIDRDGRLLTLKLARHLGFYVNRAGVSWISGHLWLLKRKFILLLTISLVFIHD